MPGPTEDYFAYVRWFERHHGALLLPVDCIEPVDPIFTYTNQYTWEMEWVLIFTDPKAYVRIMELHAKVAGLYFSRRIRFSYHYGPLPKVDAQGLPEWEPADPVFVRIDNSCRPPHLHPENDPTEHIPQARIAELVLDQLDLFDFVRATFRQRQSRKSIAEELGYRIV
ncbi:MAG: hypothetical protein WAL89_14350 [Candidatus Sulfotelmatobacter sp.]